MSEDKIFRFERGWFGSYKLKVRDVTESFTTDLFGNWDDWGYRTIWRNPTKEEYEAFEKNFQELSKVRPILAKLTSAIPEKLPGPFICGRAGKNGDDGLPEKLFVCPTFGLDGFAVYAKERDYDAPGY